jgi:hypothetical protein
MEIFCDLTRTDDDAAVFLAALVLIAREILQGEMPNDYGRRCA